MTTLITDTFALNSNENNYLYFTNTSFTSPSWTNIEETGNLAGWPIHMALGQTFNNKVYLATKATTFEGTGDLGVFRINSDGSATTVGTFSASAVPNDSYSRTPMTYDDVNDRLIFRASDTYIGYINNASTESPSVSVSETSLILEHIVTVQGRGDYYLAITGNNFVYKIPPNDTFGTQEEINGPYSYNTGFLCIINEKVIDFNFDPNGNQEVSVADLDLTNSSVGSSRHITSLTNDPTFPGYVDTSFYKDRFGQSTDGTKLYYINIKSLSPNVVELVTYDSVADSLTVQDLNLESSFIGVSAFNTKAPQVPRFSYSLV